MAKRTFTLQLGPLAVDKINGTLGHELDPGDVVFTAPAQKHAMKRHPNDYGRCLPHVATVIGNPLYVRDDFKNDGKIELVARLPGTLGEWLLVAVSIEITASGEYHVCSLYPISQKKIDARRATGHLINLK